MKVGIRCKGITKKYNWDTMGKAMSHKYIKRIPKPKGKGWYYIYKETFKNPFKALSEIFGIKEKQVAKDFVKENIEKDYGVDKKTYAAHILEFFTNKEKWNNLFRKKETRDKNKNPIKQKDLEARVSEKIANDDNVSPNDKKKKILNRSLMRKVWTIYSPEAKQIEQQEKDDKAIEKKESKEVLSENKKKESSAFKLLAGVLSDGKTEVVKNKKVGDILIDAGSTGKSGWGLNHIIEQRSKKDKKSAEEITAMLPLVIDTVANGNVKRDVSIIKDDADIGTLTIEKNGIVAFVGKSKNGKGDKFVITGFEDKNKTKEATDAINTVIAEYSYTPEFVIVKNQVGAVITSLNKLSDKNEKTSSLESEAEKKQNRSKAMLGNENAKKDGIIDDNEIEYKKEKGNEEDNNNVRSGRVSERPTDIREQRRASSGTNGRTNGGRGYGSESILNTGESGVGHGERKTDEQLRPGRGVPGRRLTKSEIKEIRLQVKELLETKKDDEFTEADKALLRQYEGAGGLGEDDASISGTLYEYYTPQTVVNKVWGLIDKYNPKQDKTVIEPASGTGRFAEGRSEDFTMFELEEDSSRINKILHPEAKVVQGYFQEQFMAGGMFAKKDSKKFDVATGNPPYGKYEGRHKGMGEGKQHTKIDEYFIDRSLDTLKPGGILAMVVPSSFLTSKDSKIKKQIEGKASLLEAWRLPNGTFSTTGVGTDIIVLRKEKGQAGALSNNQYFENNPNCIVGTETERIGRFGKPEKYIALNPGQTFDEAIEAININAIAVEEPIKAAVETTAIKKTKSERKEGKSRSEAMKGNKNAEGKHNVTGKLMSSEEFNKKYGKNISKEELDVWKVTDIDGKVNMLGLSEELQKYVENSKNYVEDNGSWIHIANYASGNIVEKLSALEEASTSMDKEEYLYKKSLLEEKLPPQKTIEQLDLSPLENWVRDYTVEVSGQPVSLINAFYLWVYNNNGYYRRGESPVTPYEIPPQISWNDVKGYIDKVPVRAERGYDKAEKAYAQKKAQKTRDLRRQTAEALFNRFLKDGLDKDSANKLSKDWNNQFNSHVNPDYEKIPMFIDGMCTHKGDKEFNMLTQQLKGVSFLSNKGSGLLAYDVGVGKTATGIVATVNQLLTGRSKKPLVCVPKAVYKKWVEEIKKHFPEQKVFEAGNLSKQYYKGEAIPEGAITVCTYEALKKMTFKEDTIAEIAKDAEYNATNPYSGKKKKTQRDIANEKNKVETLLGEMVKTSGNNTYYFEDLGFDHITIDEVHNFKNVFALPRNYKLGSDDDDKKEANEFSKIRGSSSDRGKKMYAITQYIQNKNDNRNVFALSATPFTNSPTEIYSMLSLIARHRLQKLGIFSLHEFLAKYAELKTEYVVKPDNSVKEEQVVKSFRKLQSLQNLITEYIDKVDGDEAKVIRPHKITHTPELALTDLQKQMIQNQIDYMQNAPKTDTAATIVAMNNMRMITLAPAIVDPALQDQFVESSPKLKFVCDSIIKQYKENPKNGQVMYMPRGVEHFDKVVEYLEKNGMPKNAIGVMSGGASTDKALDKRETLRKDFNNVDGKCKVIIGSGTIQEGVSLNGNTSTIYNCMLGWNPAETQQVEGRIWRQGNRQGVTHIVYPLMNDSIDALMYQKYDEKQSRIDDLWKYKGDSLNVADIDPEELKFGLIKDPEKRADFQVMREKETIANDIRQLNMQIDILYKTRDTAFADVKEECRENDTYRTAERNLKEDSTLLQKLWVSKTYGDAGKKLKKELSKMEDDALITDEILINAGIPSPYLNDARNAITRFAYENRIARYREEIDGFIKKQNENEKNYKQEKKSYERIIRQEEKRVNDNIDRAKETLKKQNILNEEQLSEKINSLSKEKEWKKTALEELKEKREEYKQKAIEEIKKNQKALPSLDEMIKQNVESISSTLRPMDEIKKIVESGRAEGKTKKEIVGEINKKIGIKKSLLLGGNSRLYIKKTFKKPDIKEKVVGL